MAAFWAVFTFGGSGPALTAHGSLDLKQEIQIQIQIQKLSVLSQCASIHGCMQCQFIPVIQIFMNIYLIIAQFNFIYAQL
jgi:hypothetical protein